MRYYSMQTLSDIPNRSATKIKDWSDSQQITKAWQASGKRVVFTNGCFDLLHVGHVSYLERAAELGDYLIIGVNDDDSVRRLKGLDRPMNSLLARSRVLAALQFVDLVTSFAEDTPLSLIRLLRPDVLVKGGDYKPEDIVGASDVVGWGGQVAVLDFVDGYSSTNYIKKLRS